MDHTHNETHNNQEDRRTTDDVASKENQYSRFPLAGGTTTTPPNHGNALARIYVTGLSLLCFNPKNDWAEIGFARPHHDLLKMSIFRNGCEPFWSSTDNFAHSMNNVGITINNSKTGQALRYENSLADNEDFGHMPDLAKLHNLDKFTHYMNPGFFSARVDIREATFYTFKMSEKKAWLHEIYDSPPPPSRIIADKEIGRILGADIFSNLHESIEIEIKYREGTGPIQTFAVPPLVNDGANKYSILLKVEPHDSGMDHIKLIYDNFIIKPTGAPRYNYEFHPYPEPAWNLCHEEARATQYACEINGGGDGPLPPFPP